MNKKKRARRVKKLLENLPRMYSISSIGYLRAKVKYPVKFILRHVGDWVLVFRGHTVKMNSMRYQNFKKNGVICAKCGIKGEYFRLEQHAFHADTSNNSFHFNLYAVNSAGNEVLMTKDHIVPKSHGGSNDLSNFQPMCSNCNTKKGNSILISQLWKHKGEQHGKRSVHQIHNSC